jgi:short-subunit dehydrogenase
LPDLCRISFVIALKLFIILKHIVISGGSKGIGLATAKAFAAAGNTITINGRDEIALYKAVEALQTNFPQASIFAKATDMQQKAQVEAFAEFALSKGAVDVLVNNAGHFVPGAIANEADGLLQQMLDANLLSAYHLTRALLPNMMAQRKGHIFNVCSIASLHAYANGGSYSISKFALLGFSKNLREELKPHQIKVTAVCPGATLTASWDGVEVDASQLMEANDIAQMIVAAASLSPQAVVEDLVMRPLRGDL